MATCVKCGKEIGILSKFWFGQCNPVRKEDYCRPCCKELKKSQRAFTEKYQEHEKKAKDDPKSAIWVALCHLICAEKVNIIPRIDHIMSGVGNEERPTWRSSKTNTIRFAEKAKNMLPSDSPGQTLIKNILNRAKQIESCEAPSYVLKEQSSSVGLIPHFTLVSELKAIHYGAVTINELMETVSSIPCGNWLLT
jgi:hypothetical protein